MTMREDERGVGTWIVLLRGINVGGRNRLPMVELRAIMEGLGCRSVQTYIQSGNVVFQATDAVIDGLPGRLAAAILEHVGLTVPVVLRSAGALWEIEAGNPFLGEGVDPAHLHVAFLAEEPDAGCVAALDPARSPGDRFVVRGSEVYLHLPHGVARTKLTNAWLDRALGTTSTVRSWKTLGKLVELAG